MPTPEEQEIERKQEAQRLALLHGGFSDIIDFENVIKEHGTDFHGAHGYTTRSGDTTKDGRIDSSRETGETDPAIVSATDSTAPSCPSPVSERKVFPAHEKDTTSESEHVKDEL